MEQNIPVLYPNLEFFTTPILSQGVLSGCPCGATSGCPLPLVIGTSLLQRTTLHPLGGDSLALLFSVTLDM